MIDICDLSYIKKNMTPVRPIVMPRHALNSPMKKKPGNINYKQNKICDRTRRKLFQKSNVKSHLNAPMKPVNSKILVDLNSVQRQLFGSDVVAAPEN